MVTTIEIATELCFKPQAGPQTDFLACPADIVFYGGAAGGGKTFALLMDFARNAIPVKGFTGVLFRRTSPEITNPGGLWDESLEILPHLGARGIQGATRWIWPNGSQIKFNHMQHEKDMYSWQGGQVALIAFDELTHFSEKMFFYMLSRNRSTCGIKPYMRATMNPDPDSWVRNFIDWYIAVDGRIDPRRSGVIRYFARREGQTFWADTREELEDQGMRPKSFTFIAASLRDNKILTDSNPDYQSNLEAQISHERARLLDGNWDARPTPGEYFKRSNFEIVEEAPEGGTTVRYYDRASTPVSPANPDPDWTRGCRMRKVRGIYYILGMASERATPHGVERLILNTAKQDPEDQVWLEEDPGQAGVADVDNLTKMLCDFDVRRNRVTKAKEVRARPFSAQVEAGNVKLVRGKWNEEFLNELEQFPDPEDKAKDDQVDSASGAFTALNSENIARVRSL